jgi:hypothetical protein
MPRRLFVLLVPLALLAGACSDDDKKAADVTTTTSTTVEATTSTTSTVPAGGSSTTAAPVPTSTTTPPGDGIRMTGPAGSGTVTWSASPERSEFCYRITVSGLGTPTEAHVHRDTGEVALALEAPASGSINTCSATDALFVEEVRAHPANFYIDVHGPKGILKATLR